MNPNMKSSLFSVRRVLKLLVYVIIIMFFCPNFLVSCDGSRNIKVSGVTAVGGLKAYGEYVVEPQLILIVLLVLPIIALAMLYSKKKQSKQAATIVMLCTAINAIVWFVFMFAAKGIAEDNYCQFSTTFWFYFNIITHIATIYLSLCAMSGKLHLDGDLLSSINNEQTQMAVNQMGKTLKKASQNVTKTAGDVMKTISSNTPQSNVIGYCPNCGEPITAGNKFCASCGSPVPEDLLNGK